MTRLTDKNQKPTFYFIGVTTGQSSAQRVFPQWMAALGRDVQLKGVDFKIHDDPTRYRRLVQEIRDDPLALGGLITTHKIDLLNAARDLFDHLGPHAQLCDEVSCISKRGGKLWGHAVDPVADGRALDALTGTRYFGQTPEHAQAEVLCLGAGGAAAALALWLIEKENPAEQPARFTFVDIDAQRLQHVQQLIEALQPPFPFRYICHDDDTQANAVANDALLAALPPGSIIINATGMGKDRPGSPITGDAQFPRHSIVWELNYRGELAFMHQALAQQSVRELTVADGWVAFLHGWTGVIAQVLDIEIDAATFDRLAEIASQVR